MNQVSLALLKASQLVIQHVLLLVATLVPLTTLVEAGVNSRPQRIVSTNLCSDQLLLALVDKTRIISVSDLGVDPEYSYYAKKAEGLVTNQALAEEIIRLEP